MSAQLDDSWYGDPKARRENEPTPGRERARADAPPALALWTTHPRRYLRRRCDDCGRRRPWQALYEAYADIGEDDHGWWLICGECLATRLSDLVAQLKLRAAS